MGFILGTSSFISSSSSSSSLLLCSHRKSTKKKNQTAMASLHSKRPQQESGSSHRRSILFVGISVLPFLQLRAIAAEDSAVASAVVSQARGLATIFISPRYRKKDRKPKTFEPPQDPTSQVSKDVGKQEEQEPELIMSEQKDVEKQKEQKPEPTVQEISSPETNQAEMNIPKQEASGSPIISLLNVLGIFASGVLAALYAASQKEKTTLESTIESMKMKLTEKDAATALLKENFEKNLLKEQEERKKQVKKLEAEEAFLSSEMSSAKGTISALGREVQRDKKLVDELKSQIQLLESAIVQAGEGKSQLEGKLKEKTDTVDVLQDRVGLLTLEINDKEKNIKNLDYLLAEKESELKNLKSIMDQTRIDLSEANSTVEQLKQELLKAREEVDSKDASLDRLNAETELLKGEKDGINKKFYDLTKEYDALKFSSEQKKVLDSKLISKKEDQLHQLEEKLELTLSKISNNEITITELMKERDDLQAMLKYETTNIRELNNELQTSKKALEASKLEASNLAKELKDTKMSNEEIMSKGIKLQDESQKVNGLLNNNLEEAKSTSKALSHELTSIKEILKRTEGELGIASNELKNLTKDRDSLKRELVEIYLKLETMSKELKEERTIVATLNRELEVMGKTMLKDSEVRKALEADLDEATKSLDEMNKSALLLSRELESTYERTATLEAEKEMFQSVIEQKNIAKGAEENMEDAKNLITRLGNERESLEKRSKQLEEELASAKGEILRLRRQISTSKKSVDGLNSKTNEVAAGTPFNVKKTTSRRRKGSSSSELS